MSVAQEKKQKQSIRDAVAHLRNQHEYVDAAHRILANGAFGEEDSDLQAEENELWAVAHGAYNACELDAIMAGRAITPGEHRQMQRAVFACQNYLDQFHSLAVLTKLTA